MAGAHRAWSSAASSCVVEGPQLSSSSAAAPGARTRATCWECTRARGEDGWEALIAGIDTMQSRCSISSTLASRPLPSLDPPRHTCRWTLPSRATAGRGCWLRKLMLGQSYAA
eukprot:scaffold34380_cov37-Phaeocystis_antarctica.AAC.2